MKITKICEKCSKKFDNKRKDGKWMGKKQFASTRFCSYKCSSLGKYVTNIYKQDGDITVMFHKNGDSTIIDTSDIKKVNKLNWHKGSNGYWISYFTKNKKRCCVLLHRKIIGKTKNKVIDHINGIKSDNRRENLRVVDHSINNVNKIIKKTKSNTGILGVFYDKRAKGYRTEISFRHKKYSRTFKLLEDAVLQRQAWESIFGFPQIKKGLI